MDCILCGNKLSWLDKAVYRVQVAHKDCISISILGYNSTEIKELHTLSKRYKVIAGEKYSVDDVKFAQGLETYEVIQ